MQTGVPFNVSQKFLIRRNVNFPKFAIFSLKRNLKKKWNDQRYYNNRNYCTGMMKLLYKNSQKLSPNRQTVAIRGTHRSISAGFREFARRTVKTLGIGTIVIKRWNDGAETVARSSSPIQVNAIIPRLYVRPRASTHTVFMLNFHRN